MGLEDPSGFHGHGIVNNKKLKKLKIKKIKTEALVVSVIYIYIFVSVWTVWYLISPILDLVI